MHIQPQRANPINTEGQAAYKLQFIGNCINVTNIGVDCISSGGAAGGAVILIMSFAAHVRSCLSAIGHDHEWFGTMSEAARFIDRM